MPIPIGKRNGNGKKPQKKIKKQHVQKKTSNFKGVVAAGGSTVKRAFGARGTGNGKHGGKGLLMCWNALNERHLSLPRAVGPYQVLRFTRVFSTNSNLVIIGAFGEQVSAAKRPEFHRQASGASDEKIRALVEKGDTEACWSSICAIAAAPEDIYQRIAGEKGWNGTTTSNDNWNTTRPCGWNMFEMGGLSQMRDGSQVAPSAVTVQIMNAQPMQTAKGQVFAAVLNTQLNRAHHGGHQTPVDIGNHMIAYQKPRLLVGGRLAVRQAQASSYPLDMTDVADFRNISDRNVAGEFHNQAITGSNFKRFWGSPHTINGSGDENNDVNDTSDSYGLTYRKIFNGDPSGWAPIVVYRPPEAAQTAVINTTKTATNAAATNNAFPDSLTYSVTIEYRARFPIEDPASSSHKTWPLATDRQWHQAISAAAALAPGIRDGFTTESKSGM